MTKLGPLLLFLLHLVSARSRGVSVPGVLAFVLFARGPGSSPPQGLLFVGERLPKFADDLGQFLLRNAEVLAVHLFHLVRSEEDEAVRRARNVIGILRASGDGGCHGGIVWEVVCGVGSQSSRVAKSGRQ